jgi:hypothetical protein
MEEMALFTLDLGCVQDPQTKAFIHPRLLGQSLWEVTPKKGGYDNALWRARQLATADNERARQANLAKYIEQGYAFEKPPEGGDDEGTPRKRKLKAPDILPPKDVPKTTLLLGTRLMYSPPQKF